MTTPFDEICPWGPNQQLAYGFARQGVDFLVAGSVALHIHCNSANPEQARDLDLVIDSTDENAERIKAVFMVQRPSAFDLEKLELRPNLHVRLKGAFSPYFADIITPKSQGEFPAMRERAMYSPMKGFQIPVMSRIDLIQMLKEAAKDATTEEDLNRRMGEIKLLNAITT